MHRVGPSCRSAGRAAARPYQTSALPPPRRCSALQWHRSVGKAAVTESVLARLSSFAFEHPGQRLGKGRLREQFSASGTASSRRLQVADQIDPGGRGGDEEPFLFVADHVKRMASAERADFQHVESRGAAALEHQALPVAEQPDAAEKDGQDQRQRAADAAAGTGRRRAGAAVTARGWWLRRPAAKARRVSAIQDHRRREPADQRARGNLEQRWCSWCGR